MSSLIKPVKGAIYTPNRVGYIGAVSRQESSSDLRYSYSYKGKNKEGEYVDNPASVRRQNPWKYTGLFQFSEIALEDVGCYRFDGTRNDTEENGLTQDWGRSGNYWTGKYGATSLSVFKNSGTIQMQAIQYWINRLCGYARNMNLNEFYGSTITGARGYEDFEVTESGVIAAIHLKGQGAVKNFLISNGEKNAVDGNKTSIAKYMSLFAHYNVQTCCKRKIYVKIVDAKKVGIPNKEVEISSEYKGTFNLGKIVVTHKTDKKGNLPVIIRHPETKIQLKIDGNLVETIIQKADQIQGYEILYLGENKYPSLLSEHKKAEATQKLNDSNSSTNNDKTSSSEQKDDGTTNIIINEVIFNIKLVEGDTGKPLPNTTYHLEYKNNIKPHKTNDSGIDSGIKADVSQSIGVYLDDDDGKKQSIYSMAFPVNGDLNGQTKVLKVPVVTLQLKFIDKNKKPISNYQFKTVYRGRISDTKKTNARGIATVKALAGQQIKIIHQATGKVSSNIVTDGKNGWIYSVDKLIEDSSSSISSTASDTLPSNTSPSSQNPNNTSDVDKGDVIRNDKITATGPTHEVKTDKAKITIKFVDESTNKPLSGLTYWTQSTKYGKNTATTGSDGTRGRTHDSDVGISIVVLVNENGKEVKKGTIVANSDNNGVAYVYKAKKPTLELSGAHWHSRFMPSTKLSSLKEPFRSKAIAFDKAMKAAGIQVSYTNAYRPPQRQYLMYYSAMIARGQIDPKNVPPFQPENNDDPVNISWIHYNSAGNIDKAASKSSGTSLFNKYGIGNNPIGKPYKSNHNGGEAFDCRISNWGIGKTIKNASGQRITIKNRADIAKVGESYGVKHWSQYGEKATGKKDDPHWSKSGR